MSLGINEIRSCRRITLKGLYGDQELLKLFILSFKKRVNEALKNIVKPANRNIHAGGKRDNFSTLPQDANSQDIRNFDKLQ